MNFYVIGNYSLNYLILENIFYFLILKYIKGNLVYMSFSKIF